MTQSLEELRAEWERLSQIEEDLHKQEMAARQVLRVQEQEHQKAASEASAAYVRLDKARYPRVYGVQKS